MKYVLIAMLGLLGLMALACGGCIFLAGTAIQKGQEMHQEKLASMTPEQRAFYDLENELQNDARRIRREFQAFITEQLKSPKTAEFELSAQAFGHDGKKAVVVTGKVTSQNSFGALLTKDVHGEYLDNGSGYKLVGLNFDDEKLRTDESVEAVSNIIEAYRLDYARLHVR